MRGEQEKRCEPYLLLHTEAVQVVTLFSKELATSYESPPDFLTVSVFFRSSTKQIG